MKKLGKILAVMMGALTVFSLTSCEALIGAAIKEKDRNDAINRNKQDYTLDMELNVPDQYVTPYKDSFKRTVWFKKASGTNLKMSTMKYNDSKYNASMISWNTYSNLGYKDDVTAKLVDNVITFTFTYEDDNTITNIYSNKYCDCTLKLYLNLNQYSLKVMHYDDDISNSVSVNYIKVNGTSYTRK